MSDVNININLVTSAARAQAQLLSKSIAGIDKQTQKTTSSVQGLGNSFSSIGTIAKGVFLGNLLQSAFASIRQLITDTIFAFTEYEKALVGVGKTTGVVGVELKELGEGIESLSREIPLATTELLDIAKVAGQLGVRGTRNITKFTEVVAKLGATTDLEGETAALTLSRLLTITGESVSTVDRLGAVIVDLGNNFAATESEIAAVALDIGRGTAQFGLASKDILSFATALKETGAQAEISGTQIGRVLREIDKAVTQGGPRLDKFAQIIGVSSDELGEFLKNDPSDVLFRFVGGLKSLQEQGTSTSQSLSSLGLNNDRIQKVIPSLVKNYDGLTKAIERSNDQYEKATALNDEAEIQFQAQKEQINLLVNDFRELQKEISEAFEPITNIVIERLRSITSFARDGAEALKELLNPPTEDLSALTEKQVFELEKLNRQLELSEENLSKVETQFLLVDEALREGNKFTKTRNGLLQQSTKATKEESTRLAIQLGLKKLEVERIRESIKAKREELGLQEGASGVETPKKAKKKQAEIEQAKFDVIREFVEANRAEKANQAIVDKELEKIRTEEDIENFKQSLIAKELIDQKFKLNELARENKQAELKKKFLEIEGKAEKEADKQRQKLNEQRIKDERQTQNNLTTLAQAGSKEAAALQKGLALRKAILNLNESTSSAYNYGVGIGGPPLGAAFAAAAIAAQVQQINAIKAAPAFQNGGIVPGSSFSGDNVQARVNSGEVILNRQQQAQTLFAIANGQGQGSSEGQSKEIVSNVTVEIDGEAIGTAVSRQVANGLVLGENQ